MKQPNKLEPTNDIVLLLTSTSQPYLSDALDLMFLPSQVSYRFRYDKKWLSSAFITDSGSIDETKVSNLRGKDAIIVHILIDQELRGYRVLEYLPLRKVTINQVQVLGEFLWLGFVLGDWVEYKKGFVEGKNEYNELFKQQLTSSTNLLNVLVTIKKGLSIQTISDKPTDADNKVLANWNLIAWHVSRFASMADASGRSPVMLKLIDVREVGSDNIIHPSKLDETQYGFKLTGGKSYFFDVAEYCYDLMTTSKEAIAPFEIIVKTEEKSIVPTISTVEVRGKYDLLRFMIKCEETGTDYLSMLHFETVGLEKRSISKTILWTKVKSRKWRNVGLPLIGFGISAFALTASTQLYNFVTSNVVNFPILILGVIGSIGTTISLSFLKR